MLTTISELKIHTALTLTVLGIHKYRRVIYLRRARTARNFQ